jgi:hypothetical protein
MAETRITSENKDISVKKKYFNILLTSALKFCSYRVKIRHGVDALSCRCQSHCLQNSKKHTCMITLFQYY